MGYRANWERTPFLEIGQSAPLSNFKLHHYLGLFGVHQRRFQTLPESGQCLSSTWHGRPARVRSRPRWPCHFKLRHYQNPGKLDWPICSGTVSPDRTGKFHANQNPSCRDPTSTRRAIRCPFLGRATQGRACILVPARFVASDWSELPRSAWPANP